MNALRIITDRKQHLFELYLLIFHGKLYLSQYLRKQNFLQLLNRLATWSIFFIIITMITNQLTGSELRAREINDAACLNNNYMIKNIYPGYMERLGSYEYLADLDKKNESPKLVNLQFLKPIIENNTSTTKNEIVLSAMSFGTPKGFINYCHYNNDDTPQKLVMPLGVSTAYFDYIKPSTIDSHYFVISYSLVTAITLTFSIALLKFKSITSEQIRETILITFVIMMINNFINPIIESLLTLYFNGFSIHNYGIQPNTIPFWSHNESVISGLIILISTLFNLIIILTLMINNLSGTLRVKKTWASVLILLGYVITNFLGWIIIAPATWLIAYTYPLLTLFF